MYVEIMLVIVNLLLALGMIWLPSIAGGEIGNLFARTWLLFGILIFLGHYIDYQAKLKKKELLYARGVMVHRHSASLGERGQGRRSASLQ